MDKKRKLSRKQILEIDPQLDPEQRLCPHFDSTSIKLFEAPHPGDMGMRVLDNCAEDHAM
jgi:hypothetical protein